MAFISVTVPPSWPPAGKPGDGGILLYTASVLLPQMGGKVNPLSSQRIDEWSPARRREGQQHVQPRQKQSQGCPQPRRSASVQGQKAVPADPAAPPETARHRRAVSPGEPAKPPARRCHSQGRQYRPARQILQQRAALPAQPAGQHPGGKQRPEGQLAQLPGAGTLAARTRQARPLCARAVEQQQCQRRSTTAARWTRRAKRLKGSLTVRLTSLPLYAARRRSRTGKQHRARRVGAPLPG